MWSAARSLWTEPAVEDPPAHGRRDQVLAAIVLVAATVEAFTHVGAGWRLAAIGLGGALAVAVLIRRTQPLVGVALAFGGFAVADVAAVLLDAEPVVLSSGAVVLVLVHTLFRWGAGRDMVLGSTLAALGLAVTVTTTPNRPEDVVGGAGVLLAAAALGAAFRYRARERDHLVEQAKLHEREQLARELHDTVAHHLSAIAIQAQAGLVRADPCASDGTAEALRVIEREAASTLAEMRAMVGALRGGGTEPSVAVRRSLADIERLAAADPGSPRIDVTLHGDLAGLPPSLEAALYRVAQESVTNARRHAHLATRVDVTVTATARDVELTVSDDGTRPAGPHAPGYGLAGMTERVSLLGGTMQAGPGPDRGWRVRAVLPRAGSAT